MPGGILLRLEVLYDGTAYVSGGIPLRLAVQCSGTVYVPGGSLLRLAALYGGKSCESDIKWLVSLK